MGEPTPGYDDLTSPNSSRQSRRIKSASAADPAEHQDACYDAGGSEDDEAWIRPVEAKERPAKQLPEDEHPGSF
jgi:hypothetical protein